MIDWQEANDFLNRGRKKYERPMYDRYLRIWRGSKWNPDSDIHIGWISGGYPTTIIKLHKDGTTTIKGDQRYGTYSGNACLQSQSVRLTIFRYAGIKVTQRDFKFYLTERDAATKPTKLMGCRQCSSTGLADMWCQGTTCWGGTFTEEGKTVCTQHPGMPMGYVGSTWHYVPCEHDVMKGHTIKRGTTCYYCNGTKKRLYGGGKVSVLWDGSPIRVQNGNIYKKPLSQLERMFADYVEPIA